MGPAKPLKCLVQALPGQSVLMVFQSYHEPKEEVATFVEHSEAYRHQVQRILASREFAAARQLREFFQYVSQAALDGRTYLDQVEIAEKVLRRGEDFNPLDDASVRKLATALRQRLERYYESEGANDPVRITLPVRSYVPQFEIRNPDLASPRQPGRSLAFSRRWLFGGTAALGLAAGASLWLRNRDAGDSRPVFRLRTRRGDLMHARNDLAPGAVLLGPPLDPVGEVTVRMLFTPERATQQAGILAYGDADHYVKLGRQFLSRPQLEFGLESQGHYQKPPGTFDNDLDAQTGEPVWLCIRRRYDEYRAYLSQDGTRWRPFGRVLVMSPSPAEVRAAIFAHNGRSDAPPADARFDRLSVGHSFHNLPAQPFTASLLPGWRFRGDPGVVRLDGECLVVDFPETDRSMTVDLVRPVPEQNWTVSTRLDFLSVNGSAAGLILSGPKGRFRLIRWDLDGGSLTAEHLSHRQINQKDFEGAPPIILRLVCRRGVVHGAVSRDDRHFLDLPLEVPLRALGDGDLWIGFHTSTSTWKPGDPRPSARFFHLRQELDSLVGLDHKSFNTGR